MMMLILLYRQMSREQLFNNEEKFIRLDKVEIFQKNHGKFRIFDALGDDDLIKNYSFKVGGYNFLEPRFYFSRKNKKTERDLKIGMVLKVFSSGKSQRFSI